MKISTNVHNGVKNDKVLVVGQSYIPINYKAIEERSDDFHKGFKDYVKIKIDEILDAENVFKIEIEVYGIFVHQYIEREQIND